MTQFLLSTYQPDGPPPPSVDMNQIIRDLTALSAELRAAGAWVFAAHLNQASTATVVRVQDGEPLVTEGPYTEGSEHIGGITIIEAPDREAALGWAQKLADATTLPVELRPFFENRDGLE